MKNRKAMSTIKSSRKCTKELLNEVCSVDDRAATNYAKKPIGHTISYDIQCIIVQGSSCYIYLLNKYISNLKFMQDMYHHHLITTVFRVWNNAANADAFLR